MKKLILMAALALTSCATIPPAPVVAPAQHQADIAQWFAAHPEWGMNGRVAVNAPTGSGSGSLEWVTLKDGFTATISAPITRQSWKLTSRAGSDAMIEGLSGGPRTGSSAQALLQEVTGWNIPLAQLQNWMKGLAPSNVTRDPRTGLPQRFVDGEWTVTYEEWSHAEGDVPVLPKRISATKSSDTRVRLIIDTWNP